MELEPLRTGDELARFTVAQLQFSQPFWSESV